jgi:hypothetical protein
MFAIWSSPDETVLPKRSVSVAARVFQHNPDKTVVQLANTEVCSMTRSGLPRWSPPCLHALTNWQFGWLDETTRPENPSPQRKPPLPRISRQRTSRSKDYLERAARVRISHLQETQVIASSASIRSQRDCPRPPSAFSFGAL